MQTGEDKDLKLKVLGPLKAQFHRNLFVGCVALWGLSVPLALEPEDTSFVPSLLAPDSQSLEIGTVVQSFSLLFCGGRYIC